MEKLKRHTNLMSHRFTRRPIFQIATLLVPSEVLAWPDVYFAGHPSISLILNTHEQGLQGPRIETHVGEDVDA